MNWQLPVLVTTVFLYSPSRDLLLTYDRTTNTSYPNSTRVQYIGSGLNFTIRLKGVQRSDNGTYVCTYNSERYGRTLVVTGKAFRIYHDPQVTLCEINSS